MFKSSQRLWHAITKKSVFSYKFHSSSKYFITRGIPLLALYSYFCNDINTFCDEIKDISKRIITTTPETCLFVWGDNYYGIADPLSDSISIKLPNIINIPETFSLKSLNLTLSSIYELKLSLKELSKLFGSRIISVSLAQKHAACIDPTGNLIQWGHGFNGLSSFIDDPLFSKDTSVFSTLSPHEKQCHSAIPNSEKINRNPETTIVGHNLTLLTTTIDQGKLFIAEGIRLRPWISSSDISPTEPISFVDKISSSLCKKPTYCSKIIQIASGDHHVIFLTNEGNVITMAINSCSNMFGQLGYDPNNRNEATELKNLFVFKPPPSAPLLNNGKMLQQAIRVSDSLLTSDQKKLEKVSSQQVEWREALMKLKEDLVDKLENPIFWKLDIGNKVEQIAAGTHHTLLQTSLGQVWGFGANGYGQLGKDALIVNTVPFIITPCFSSPVKGIFAGGDTSAFLTQMPPKGLFECYTMGAGMLGQLGNNTFRQYQSTMVPVSNISRLSHFNERTGNMSPIHIQSISMGRAHIAAVIKTSIKNQGEFPQFGFNVFTWGSNHAFQLGTGKRAMASTPIQPNALSSIKEILSQDVAEEVSITINSSLRIGMQLFPGIVQKKNSEQYIVPPQKIVCGIDTTAIF